MVTDPLVSVVLVNYNGRSDLEASLPSLLAQTYPAYEVLVVDNGSQDDSVTFLRQAYPEVKVIEAGRNLGFGAGNNRGVEHSAGELIVFTNYDVEFDREWLRCLVTRALTSPEIGLVAPKILLYDQPEQMQTCGLALQYTGHIFSRGLRQPSTDFDRSCELPCVSGCAFLIKKSVLDEVGGFDETYHHLDSEFFHSSFEDVDLSWRARLAGHKIVYEPSAIMYHKYVPKPMTLPRFRYLERGRHYTLLKDYSYSTLLGMLPALGFAECITLCYSVLRGPRYVVEKLRCYGWLLRAHRQIAEAHRVSQSVRRVSDREIVTLLQHGTELRHAPLPKWLVGPTVRVINAAFEAAYWQLALVLSATGSASDNLA